MGKTLADLSPGQGGVVKSVGTEQTALKITDALGSYKDRMVNRDDFFLIQAPDAYRFGMLYDCFDPAHPNGHPAVQLPEKARGCNAFFDGRVFKVTHPDDLKIVEAMM